LSQAADARSGDRKDTWRRALRHGSTSTQRRVRGLYRVDSLMAILDALIVTSALSAIRVDLGGSIEELESSR
jgi:hypothetical protein